jgi:hypothetical protein
VLEGPSSFNYVPVKYDYHHAADGMRADEFELRMLFNASTETSLPGVPRMARAAIRPGIFFAGFYLRLRTSPRSITISWS